MKTAFNTFLNLSLTSNKNTISQKIKITPPEKLFLIIASAFCACFVFIVPPLQGWDEATHFLRAYHVSEGHVLPQKLENKQVGGYIPENVIAMYNTFHGDLGYAAQNPTKAGTTPKHLAKYMTTNDKGEKKPQRFEESAVYSPIAYLPASTGIATASTLHLPLLMYVYFARIFTLVAFIALMYWAIKIIPIGKWVLFVVALLPQAATLGVSLGSDALIIGLVSIIMAIYLRIIHQKHTITVKQLVLVGGLLAALILTKQPYGLIALLFLFLPINKFGSTKRYLLSNGALLFIAGILGILWLSQVSDIARDMHLVQRPGVHVNSVEQTEQIIHNPPRYLAILGNSIFTQNGTGAFIQLTNGLTWRGILVPEWAYLISYIVLFLSFVATAGERFKNKLGRLYYRGPLLLFIAMIGVLYTSLYLVFSEVKASPMQGINGRYFLPLLCLLIPFVSRYTDQPLLIKIDKARAPVLFAVTMSSLLTVALICMICANYLPDII